MSHCPLCKSDKSSQYVAQSFNERSQYINICVCLSCGIHYSDVGKEKDKTEPTMIADGPLTISNKCKWCGNHSLFFSAPGVLQCRICDSGIIEREKKEEKLVTMTTEERFKIKNECLQMFYDAITEAYEARLKSLP